MNTLKKNFSKATGVLLILLLSFSAMNAQITSQGNFIVGGTFGFSAANSDVEENANGNVTTTEGATASQLNIAPSIGYFVTDNFALGFGLDYTLSTVDNTNDNTSIDSDLLFGPFTRYYLPVGEDKAFFLEANAGFGNSIDEITIDGTTQNINNNIFAIGIGPGFTIFSNDAIGIEALMKYNYARSEADIDINGESLNTTTFTNQLDFSVGLQVYFARLNRAK